jgi:hypothetical protein
MMNFPASSYMTDFEIVEIDNERRRKIRSRRKAVQFRANQERERHVNHRLEIARIADEERDRERNEAEVRHLKDEIFLRQFGNRLIYRVIPEPGIDLVPGPISLLLSPPRPTNNSESDSDTNNDEFKHPEDYNLRMDDQIEIIVTTEETLDDTTGSSGSYNSAKSNNSSSSFHTNSPKALETDANYDKKQFQSPLPIRYNDITFMSKINNLKRTTKGLPRYVISSMRPSYACATDHDYFICHTCHLFPPPGTGKYQGTNDKNEHPFVRNIKAILKHIRINHCEKLDKKDRQLTANAESYVLFKKKELVDQKLPLLQTKTSIPKSPSESCLQTAWKSNQTEITKEIVNTYYFQGILTQGQAQPLPCKGHPKLISNKGPEYYLDLANSVYCSCNAQQILNIEEIYNPEWIPSLSHTIQIDDNTDHLTLDNAVYCSYDKRIPKRTRFKNPGPTPIYSHKNDIIQMDENTPPTFFNLERTSVLQSHGIFACPFTYRLKLPQEVPTWTGNTQTRSMTKKKEEQSRAQNTSTLPNQRKLESTHALNPKKGMDGQGSRYHH